MAPGSIRRVINHPRFVNITDRPQRVSNHRQAGSASACLRLNEQPQWLAEGRHKGEFTEDIDLMNSSSTLDLEVSRPVGLQFGRVLALVDQETVASALYEACEQFLKQVSSEDIVGDQLGLHSPFTSRDHNTFDTI